MMFQKKQHYIDGPINVFLTFAPQILGTECGHANDPIVILFQKIYCKD